MIRFITILTCLTLSSPAIADWRCNVDRCQEYTNCSFNSVSMACSYKSGGVEYGGVFFENGEVFSIEWISKYFDKNSNLIEEPKEGYYAWVNNIRRRFNIRKNRCVEIYKTKLLPKFEYGKCG